MDVKPLMFHAHVGRDTIFFIDLAYVKLWKHCPCSSTELEGELLVFLYIFSCMFTYNELNKLFMSLASRAEFEI
jgi:hypothetical protein